ncbi:MAG: hypothetical protein F4Y49_06315 [Dehalococcoidia bacterium]|nr:hypothetical protein [Dehalococcoidia bacterium]
MNKKSDAKLDREGTFVPALLYGRLKDVNLEQRTAKLVRYPDDHVPLSFDADLDDEMVRNEDRQYIEVSGHGIINENDRWEIVYAKGINHNRDGGFDLEAFLDNPNPKIFDPDNMTTINMTDEEWELFESAFRGSRED